MRFTLTLFLLQPSKCGLQTRMRYSLMRFRTLLDYLSTKDLLATFFVVGSRVIERPQVLLEEYMTGHELSVHTWSHRVRCL